MRKLNSNIVFVETISGKILYIDITSIACISGKIRNTHDDNSIVDVAILFKGVNKDAAMELDMNHWFKLKNRFMEGAD